jgi:hypothetical protein
MPSRPYSIFMATLMVGLAGLALWQFYSLLWGHPFGDAVAIAGLP